MRDADLVLVDGDIHTMDSKKPRAKAIAFGGSRVLAVGSNAQAERWTGRGTKIVALRGRVVVPGFIDAHAHLMESASRLSNLRLHRCHSSEEVLDVLREGVARAKPGGWVVGDDWDETRWPEPRYLTRDDLDRVSATVPVAAIRVDLHMASVNSAALGILSIPPHTRGFEIDPSGHPTGVLKEEALARIWDFIWPSPDRFAKSFLRVARAALALGITTVHDIVNETELRAYQIAKAVGHLPLRVYVMAREPLLPYFAAAGLARRFGDEWLRLGAIKVFSDGSLGARTAALLEPYADEPRETGHLIHSPDELRTLVARIHDAGFQAAVHAVGDRAIETVVDAMERAIPDGHSLRHRIEHAELLHPEHIDRMKDHGIVASCQPNFVGRWSFPGGMYERRLGPERLRRNNPYREILEKRVVLAFGSDGMPYGPLGGIHAAVNAPFDVQRLTVDEAFVAYTRGGALAGTEESETGTLTPGALGDAVILDGDPWKDLSRIRSTRVGMTIIGGRVAYRR